MSEKKTKYEEHVGIKASSVIRALWAWLAEEKHGRETKQPSGQPIPNRPNKMQKENETDPPIPPLSQGKKRNGNYD